MLARCFGPVPEAGVILQPGETGNFKTRGMEMKRRFWNVGIEIYADGRVLAAVLRTREAKYQPPVAYRKEPGRECFSLWYETEAEALGAVIEAKAMNEQQGVAA
jgi:hypothetical protein